VSNIETIPGAANLSEKANLLKGRDAKLQGLRKGEYPWQPASEGGLFFSYTG
jgi:hypothetical protein